MQATQTGVAAAEAAAAVPVMGAVMVWNIAADAGQNSRTGRIPVTKPSHPADTQLETSWGDSCKAGFIKVVYMGLSLYCCCCDGCGCNCQTMSHHADVKGSCHS